MFIFRLMNRFIIIIITITHLFSLQYYATMSSSYHRQTLNTKFGNCYLPCPYKCVRVLIVMSTRHIIQVYVPYYMLNDILTLEYHYLKSIIENICFRTLCSFSFSCARAQIFWFIYILKTIKLAHAIHTDITRKHILNLDIYM